MLKRFVVALVLSAAACTGSFSGVSGSGVVVREARQVPAFTAVHAAGSVLVEIEVGPAQSVHVEADDNVAPKITTVVSEDVLTISASGSFNTSSPVKVVVTTPVLAAIEGSGSGRVQVRGISGERFAVQVSGSGKVELAGKADELVATLGGSGSLVAVELKCIGVTAEVSGSGSAQVFASERLMATLSGSGSLRYAGGAEHVVSSAEGSGSVEPM